MTRQGVSAVLFTFLVVCAFGHFSDPFLSSEVNFDFEGLLPALNCIGQRTCCPPSPAGDVYVMTDSSSNNELLAYDRYSDGSLTFGGRYRTQGEGASSNLAGTADVLQSQNPVILSSDNSLLFAVDPSSDDIALFAVTPQGGLAFQNSYSDDSFVRPVSLAYSETSNVLYVADQTDEVSVITAISVVPGSPWTLSFLWRDELDTSEVTQVGLTSDENKLVAVSPSGVWVFTLDALGVPTDTEPNNLGGRQPFAFAFSGNYLLLTEANGLGTGVPTLSVWQIGSDNSLNPVQQGVLLATSGEGNSFCRIVTSGNWAFVSNGPADTISALQVNNGAVVVVQTVDASTTPGNVDFPTDLAVAEGTNGGSSYLYSLNSLSGSLSVYQIGTGSAPLTLLDTVEFPGPLAGLNGIVAF